MIEQIKNAFQRNKIQKIVALLSAIALWFFVMDTQNPTINGSYDVPLTMANIPNGYKAVFREQTVRVKLSAPRSYFIDYGVNNIRAFANLQNYSAEGEYEIPIEASFPKGFEIESISPTTIHVQLDPFIEKQMAADVIITGMPVENSVVRALEKSSTNLTLIGPKTAVENVKRVIGYIGLNGNAETFDILVPMTAIDDDGREVPGVRVAPSVITVTVHIEREFQKKVVPIVADITVPEGREISELLINPQTVEIVARREILTLIDSIKTEPLNFMVNAKTFIGKLKLHIPDGVTSNVNEVDVTCKFKD
jgi:YbbR domain-containing protein